MSRRKTVSNLMRVAIDDKSAHDFAWALLELASVRNTTKRGSFPHYQPQTLKI
jgi:hypothetical protein